MAGLRTPTAANPFWEAVQDRQLPLQAWMWDPSVLTAELMCAAGYDSVGFDLQHGAVDFGDLYALMAVVAAHGVTPVVRISSVDDLGSVTRVLDGGARGVICPNVDTPEQARAFAAACKYPPTGTRGFGPVRPAIGKSAGYTSGADAYSLTSENAAVMAIVQIESAEGLANVDAILAVDGIDGVFPGPLDLSLSLYDELIGDLADERLRVPLQRIIDAAHAVGKPVGLPPFTADKIPMLVEMGTDWFQIGNDVAWVGTAATQTVAAAREHTLTTTPPEGNR